MKQRISNAALGLGAFLLALAATVWMVARVYEASVDDLEWQRPWIAWLSAAMFIAWALMTLWPRRTPQHATFRVASIAPFKKIGSGGWRSKLIQLPTILLAVGTCLSLAALAGPQSLDAKSMAELEGIDMVLALDMSESMKDGDILPSRFDAMKNVVDEFVSRRPNDRIGVVVFGMDAYTLLPLTTDKDAIRNAVVDLQLGMVDGSGTAIGNAVATSLNRLRRSTAQSRVVILLTDGESTAGDVYPVQATQLATALDVPVFTILMGATRDFRVFGRAAPVNPKLLKSMAKDTGGNYYAAADRKALSSTLHSILDKLEKSQLEEAGTVFAQLYGAFLWPALVCLMFSALLGATLLRRWP